MTENFEWRLMQENIQLRKEIHALQIGAPDLRSIINVFKVLNAPVPKGKAFTDKQRELIEHYGMDYQAIYRLSKRYESVFDAFMEITEVIV